MFIGKPGFDNQNARVTRIIQGMFLLLRIGLWSSVGATAFSRNRIAATSRIHNCDSNLSASHSIFVRRDRCVACRQRTVTHKHSDRSLQQFTGLTVLRTLLLKSVFTALRIPLEIETVSSTTLAEIQAAGNADSAWRCSTVAYAAKSPHLGLPFV